MHINNLRVRLCTTRPALRPGWRRRRCRSRRGSPRTWERTGSTSSALGFGRYGRLTWSTHDSTASVAVVGTQSALAAVTRGSHSLWRWGVTSWIFYFWDGWEGAVWACGWNFFEQGWIWDTWVGSLLIWVFHGPRHWCPNSDNVSHQINLEPM